MELERPRASASFAPAALASVASVTPVAPVPLVIPAASVTPVAPVPSVILPITHSTIEISDDEDTAVSHSPITISDDEDEIDPVRRLPAVRPLQSLVDPQYGGDSDEETPISSTALATHQQHRAGYQTMLKHRRAISIGPM